MRVLITGATGAIGQALCNELIAQEHHVIATTRQKPEKMRTQHDGSKAIEWLHVGDIDGHTDWHQALKQVEVVIHLAARVHILREISADPLKEFRTINTDGTLNLARQAAKSGVRRFIFLSSIGVNGNFTEESAFTERATPRPHDAYAVSKHEAEQGLLAMSSRNKMEVVIVRPPLVYGPGVKGNFSSLVRWIQSGIPLPLGAVHNKRSLIALDNLVNFIGICLDPVKTPAAANEIFLISDGEDISTSQLLSKVADAFGIKSRLWPIPVGVLWLAASLTGKRRIANRLLASLLIDSSKAHKLLGWRPVVTIDQQLKKMANHATRI